MKSRLEKAIDVAIAKVQESGDISGLEPEVRIVAMVHAAQGVIDNGGLQFFFEADFPAKPPYSVFIEAYRAIGADDAASTLERAVALFPFKDPHRHVRKRNRFLDSFKDADGVALNSPFEPLASALCGNAEVWRCLAGFVEKHAASFGLA